MRPVVALGVFLALGRVLSTIDTITSSADF